MKEEEKIEQSVQVIKKELANLLTSLYLKLCDCRRSYPELDQFLNPDFHLEDCPYQQKVGRYGIDFGGEEK